MLASLGRVQFWTPGRFLGIRQKSHFPGIQNLEFRILGVRNDDSFEDRFGGLYNGCLGSKGGSQKESSRMPKIARVCREMRFGQNRVDAVSVTIDHFLESFLEIPDFRQIADTNRYCCFLGASKTGRWTHGY